MSVVYFNFYFRYKFIVFPLMSKVECNRRTCNQILQAAGIQNSEIGKTKVGNNFNFFCLVNTECDFCLFTI